MIFPVIWIHARLTSQKRVDDDVFHPGYEVVFHGYLVLDIWPFGLELFRIEIVLKVLEAQGVSVLMLAIFFFVFHLHALVCKMDIQIALVKGILRRRSPQVTLLVEVNFISSRSTSPDTDVELSLFVEQRTLYVLLDNAESTGGSRVYEVQHFVEVRENFNSFTLVHIRWLH